MKFSVKRLGWQSLHSRSMNKDLPAKTNCCLDRQVGPESSGFKALLDVIYPHNVSEHAFIIFLRIMLLMAMTYIHLKWNKTFSVLYASSWHPTCLWKIQARSQNNCFCKIISIPQPIFRAQDGLTERASCSAFQSNHRQLLISHIGWKKVLFWSSKMLLQLAISCFFGNTF